MRRLTFNLCAVLLLFGSGSVAEANTSLASGDDPCQRFKMEIITPPKDIDFKIGIIPTPKDLDRAMVINPCPDTKVIVSAPRIIRPGEDGNGLFKAPPIQFQIQVKVNSQ